MKTPLLALCAMACGLPSVAAADHLLFPIIVSNPKTVVTLISVVNTAADHGFLKYTYVYKSPDNLAGCRSQTFVRSTHPGDVVTFDVSGYFGNGQPLNKDTDTYEGPFNLDVTDGGVYRGYLVVNHYDPTPPGGATKEGAYTLSGQATIMDIVTGSAWGYQAVNDPKADEKPDFKAVATALTINQSVPFTFMPLETWTTKFFVTPVSSDMTSIDPILSSKLLFNIYNENSSNYSVTVLCTGAIDLKDVLSAAAVANLNETGGWGFLKIDNASGNAPAIVYKLDYTTSTEYIKKGQSANNGFLILK